ncbi:hypothetical protein IE81DRAFT_288951, partial [Ceraceosorus guamensis]
KKFWQTDKRKGKRISWGFENLNEGQGWTFSMLHDNDIASWTLQNLGQPDKVIWDRINQPILHADLWRYLILTLPTYGGIYSDSDTQCLKPFSAWGRNATFWSVSNLSLRQVTRPPSVILAVEADVGSNQEWFKWWARPLQFVQWTMGSAPGHPIFIDLLRRINSRPRPTDASLLPIFEKMESLLAEAALLESTPLVDSDTQGELSIMELTGPGVWTDSVVNYLKVRYGLDWTRFKDLEHPVRVGELAILPRTAFSPGVNTPGFGPTWDDEAMVYHEVSRKRLLREPNDGVLC